MITKKMNGDPRVVDKKFISNVAGTVAMWGVPTAVFFTAFACAVSGVGLALFSKRAPTIMEGLIDALPGIASITGIAMLIGLLVGIDHEWDAAVTRRDKRVQSSEPKV